MKNETRGGFRLLSFFALLAALPIPPAWGQQQPLGLFDGHTDVGSVS